MRLFGVDLVEVKKHFFFIHYTNFMLYVIKKCASHLKNTDFFSIANIYIMCDVVFFLIYNMSINLK